MSKVVLAYSGGLDTSVILKWLIERGHEVVACCVDVGQDDDLDEVGRKALAVGAAKVVIEDVREEFVTDFIFTALKANAFSFKESSCYKCPQGQRVRNLIARS